MHDQSPSNYYEHLNIKLHMYSLFSEFSKIFTGCLSFAVSVLRMTKQIFNLEPCLSFIVLLCCIILWTKAKSGLRLLMKGWCKLLTYYIMLNHKFLLHIVVISSRAEVWKVRRNISKSCLHVASWQETHILRILEITSD